MNMFAFDIGSVALLYIISRPNIVTFTFYSDPRLSLIKIGHDMIDLLNLDANR